MSEREARREERERRSSSASLSSIFESLTELTVKQACVQNFSVQSCSRLIAIITAVAGRLPASTPFLLHFPVCNAVQGEQNTASSLQDILCTTTTDLTSQGLTDLTWWRRWRRWRRCWQWSCESNSWSRRWSTWHAHTKKSCEQPAPASRASPGLSCVVLVPVAVAVCVCGDHLISPTASLAVSPVFLSDPVLHRHRGSMSLVVKLCP